MTLCIEVIATPDDYALLARVLANLGTIVPLDESSAIVAVRAEEIALIMIAP